MTQTPERTRTSRPPAWDERTQLATFLDYVRQTARDKCAGVSPEDARSAPLPGSPLMSLCGLISHLRWVEYYWFEVVFLGGDDSPLPWTREDPDREMRIALDVPLGQLLTEYERQAERHRELVAAHDLDERAAREAHGRRPDLRWIILHLIEETARHNGHIDILREMADGVTGS